MLTLRFADASERAILPPAGDAPGVHVWRNRAGGIVAYGYRERGDHWMHWPGLATFRFGPARRDVTAFAEPAASRAAIWDTYRRSVLPMACQAQGLEALHASAVVSPEGLVAFCAASETGKSTIAFGLRRRGAPQWADDGVVFRAEGGNIISIPLPFEVRLRPQSRAIFGADASRTSHSEDNGPGDQIHAEPAAFAAICILSRVEARAGRETPRIRRLQGAEAFSALLAHAHVFDPTDHRRRERMLVAYLDVAATVPIFEVAFAPIPGQLDTLLDVIGAAFGLQPQLLRAGVAAG